MDRLDSDLLRTFLAVLDTGSVTAGAKRILRSQSATSMQIKQLEQVLDRPVFLRKGRGIVPTPTAERLEPVARQVVGALDRTLAELRQTRLQGPLRVGLPETGVEKPPGAGAKAGLVGLVSAFMREHPGVDLFVRRGVSAAFPEELARGALDLAVHEVETVAPDMILLREEPMVWARARGRPLEDLEPMPVALFDRACWWRDSALASLRAGSRPFRIVYSSESTSGVLAAIEAGFAIGVLSRKDLAGRPIEPVDSGLGPLPSSKVVLQFGTGDRTPEAMALADLILSAHGGALTSPRFPVHP